VISNQPDVLTLSQLTAGIAKVFDENFPNSFWIRAELAKLNHYPGSGHCYPTLVEKEKGTVKAEIRGNIWANDFQRINQKFIQVTKEPLKEGIRILFRALVKYHPVYGLSLQINDIDPSYTLGEMAREKMETIIRLKNEGLFERNQMMPLPLLPKRIAIISVKTSNGFSDFINILGNNPWGYAFSCVLFPALLQGEKAVDSIISQLRRIDGLSDHFDVVAIIRGGGGEVGLNCYDNYQLAREVALCRLPVLTGIGHSTNETVVEMIAGINKITPTDVAYFLIQHFHNFSARLEESRVKIITFSQELLEEEKRGWGELSKKVLSMTENKMLLEKGLLEQLSGRMISVSKAVLAKNRHSVSLAGSRLRLKPGLLIREQESALAHKSVWLKMRAGQFMTNHQVVIEKFEQQVRLLDPQNVLKRGYSITCHKGKALTDIAGIEPGEIVITRLHKGEIISEVKSKKE
jgi:exodeoxyribonuclease VII large subunit